MCHFRRAGTHGHPANRWGLRTATRNQARDSGTTLHRRSSNAFNGGVSQSSSLPLSSDPSPRRYCFLRTNRDRRQENGQHFAAIRLDPVPQVGECIRLTRLHTRTRVREPARAVPGSGKSGFSPSWWCHHDTTACGLAWMLKRTDGSLPICPDRSSPAGRRRVTPRSVLRFRCSATAGLRLTDTPLAGRNSVHAKRGFRWAGIGKRLKSRSDVQSSDIPCDEQMAAIRASCTMGPLIFPRIKNFLSSVQWSLDSQSKTTDGEPIQASICSVASFVVEGGS